MKATPTLQAAFWSAVAGMAFFAMAASSPQCTRTPESVNGLDLGTQGSENDCTQDCIDRFQGFKRQEQQRFKAVMAACNGDDACRARESALHDQVVAEIAADKDACIANCAHEQGTGVGGQ